jgi:hypothetical protein
VTAFDIARMNDPEVEAMLDLYPGVTPFGHEGLRLSEFIDAPGDLIFRAARQNGLEGIVSKRLHSVHRSGRVKTNCPGCQRPYRNGPLRQCALRLFCTRRAAAVGLQLALTG